jgi:hypothetical protein
MLADISVANAVDCFCATADTSHVDDDTACRPGQYVSF